MYVGAVLIDHLRSDGLLTTYLIRSRTDSDRVILDRLLDIDPQFVSIGARDLGGVRVYNSTQCSITRVQAMLRPSLLEHGRIEVAIEHRAIPMIGPALFAYNLVLPPEYRFSLLDVSEEQEPRRIVWDPQCRTAIAMLERFVRDGPFTLQLIVHAGRGEGPEMGMTHEEAVHNAVDLAFDDRILDEGGRVAIAEDLSRSVLPDWLMLEPNLFGLGLRGKELLDALVAKMRRPRVHRGGRPRTR